MRSWNLGFYTFGAIGLIESLYWAFFGSGDTYTPYLVAAGLLLMGLVGGVLGVVVGALTRWFTRADEWTFRLLTVGVSAVYYLYWVIVPARGNRLAQAALLIPFGALTLAWAWLGRSLTAAFGRRARPMFVVSVGCLLASGAVAYRAYGSGPPAINATAPVPNPKNVVVIVVDTLRADRLGCYGNRNGLTPSMDSFARSAVVFDNAYSQMPYTVASVGSLFTSLYPYALGSSILDYRVTEKNRTLAEILRRHGYQTAGFIAGFPLESQVSGLARGFERFDENLSVLNRVVGPHETKAYQLTVMRYLWRWLGRNEISLQRRAGQVNEAVFSWLRNEYNPVRPLFLWVHYFDPHIAYDPPEPFDRLHGSVYSGTIDGSVQTLRKIWARQLHPSREDIERIIALYDGEVAYTDFELGHLLDYLEAFQILKNSIVILAADHGESLWEHDYPFSHGDLVYNPSMHVPLIVKGLEGLPVGHSSTVVQLVDVMPTVLAALGIPAPQGIDGRNLLPLLGARDAKPTQAAFGQAVGKARPGDEPNGGPEVLRCYIATDRWKVIARPDRDLEVYDLAADPTETHTLPPSAAAPDLARRLHQYMFQAATQAHRGTPLEREVLDNLRSLGYLK